MTSKLMSFIEKANKIIFFIGTVVLLLLFSVIMLNDIFSSRHEPPTIEIIEDTASHQDITLNKRYFGQVDTWFVFEISAEKLKSSDGSKGAFYMFDGSARFDSSGLQSNTINLLFTAADGGHHLLLDKPLLITEVTFQRTDKSSDDFVISKNLYTFAPKDSNGDNYLDYKDDEDFWVSNADGKNLKKVISNIDHYRIIEDNTVIIKKADQFYLYYVVQDKLVQLDTTLKTS